MEKLQNIKQKVGAIVQKKGDTDTGKVNFGYQPSDISENVAPPAYSSRKESVMEHAPNIENYRMSIKRPGTTTRPSLDELHEERLNTKRPSLGTIEQVIIRIF